MCEGEYFITPHAVERYIERINPGIDYNQALAEIIKSLKSCLNIPTRSEEGKSLYLRVETPRKFVAVIDKGHLKPSVRTILEFKHKFNYDLKYQRKRWRYSDELFVRLNYGKMTYKEMQKHLREFHSETSISWKVVQLGISNKRNWSEEEINLLCTDKSMIKRSNNACKIKKSRLCIR